MLADNFTFSPNLNIILPDMVLDVPQQVKPSLTILRRLYQQALIDYLRQQNAAQALLQMQQAIEGVLASLPLDTQRAFWWVASAYIDCLRFAPSDVPDTSLLNRIDLQIRALIAQQTIDEDLMRQMLYIIAISDTQSSLVATVKQAYALSNYLPDEINSELLPIFLDEAEELLPQIRLGVAHWREQPHNQQLAQKVWRQLHTLKGSARMTGLMAIGLRIHELEDFVMHDNIELHGIELQDKIEQLCVQVQVLRPETIKIEPKRKAKQRLLGKRQVEFSTIFNRLQLVVSSVSKEINKPVQFELQGGELLLERDMLKRITAPLEHMLRNSLVHGIEPAAQRIAAGKPAMGRIVLSLTQQNAEICISMSDDGIGLNLVALRQKALAKGILQAHEVLSDEQLIQLMYVPGISTAQRVTELAGRGIGMDVVRSEVLALGGNIDVVSQTGGGVQFLLKFPLE